MSMKHFEHKPNHKIKRVKTHYERLLNPATSTQMKLLSVEFLASFVDEPEHRRRLETLCKRETNYIIRKLMKEVLEGEYEPPKLDDFLPGVNIEDKIDEIKKNKAEYESKENKEASNMINYRKTIALQGRSEFEEDL